MLPSEHYRQPEAGAVLTALHEITARCGYLPEDEVRKAATELGVPLAQTFSAATFYAAFSFKPCGRHKIQVCEGTACYVKGAAALMAGPVYPLESLGASRTLTVTLGPQTSEALYLKTLSIYLPVVMASPRSY